MLHGFSTFNKEEGDYSLHLCLVVMYVAQQPSVAPICGLDEPLLFS